MNFWIKENLYIVIAAVLLSPVTPWIFRTLFKEPRTELQEHIIKNCPIIIWVIAIIGIAYNVLVMMR